MFLLPFPILQWKELIPREIKSVAQSHTAQLCQCQDSNPRHGGWIPTTALSILPLPLCPFTGDFTVRGLDRHALVPDPLRGQLDPRGSHARTSSLCPGPIAGARTAATPRELRAPLQMGSTASPREGPSTSLWEWRLELEAQLAQEAWAPGPTCRDLAPAQVRGHCPLGEAGSQRTTAESLEQPLLRLTKAQRHPARLVAAKA